MKTQHSVSAVRQALVKLCGDGGGGAVPGREPSMYAADAAHALLQDHIENWGTEVDAHSLIQFELPAKSLSSPGDKVSSVLSARRFTARSMNFRTRIGWSFLLP